METAVNVFWRFGYEHTSLDLLMREMGIDLKQSWMIGDRWRDVDCGFSAGCRTVFIDNGYSEELRAQPDFRVTTLLKAAKICCEN